MEFWPFNAITPIIFFGGGLRAVEAVLASWGIPADAVALRDGSGLSRYDNVTPDTLVRVLSHMHREPAHTGPFFSVLNVAGQGGSIVNTMPGSTFV